VAYLFVVAIKLS